MDKVLTIESISFFFDKKEQILKDILFYLNKSEVISIIGKSGCGKTTLLNLIAGLLTPTKGSIVLDTLPLLKPSVKISYLTQTPSLLPYRTALENAYLGLELRNELNQNTKDIVKTYFSYFNLNEAKDKYPMELSGGMIQRVGIIQTISVNSLIYLLDEPFSAIDRHNTEKIEDFLWEEKEKNQSSYLVITHDLEQAISISDRVLVLKSNPGEIFQELRFDEEYTKLIPSSRKKHPKHSQYLYELVKIFSEL